MAEERGLQNCLLLVLCRDASWGRPLLLCCLPSKTPFPPSCCPSLPYPGHSASLHQTFTAAAPEEDKIPSGPLYILSPEMAKFVGVPKLQRTQCLKRVWEYVKAKGLQDGRDIRVDATLATLFESPLNGPQIMKQLSRHMVEKIEGSSLKGQLGVQLPGAPFLLLRTFQ